MTHDELLAKINESIKAAEFEERWMWTISAQALLAVVELHEPWELTRRNGDLMEVRCSFCASYEYPCPTIQAIEKEL